MRKSISSRWTYSQEDEGAFEAPPELLTLGYDRFTEAAPLSDHRHEKAYEFVYIESGRATWEVGGESYASHAGQLFHTRPGEVHRARLHHIEPCAIWWMIVLDPAESEGWLRLEARERLELAAGLRQAERVATTGPGVLDPFRRMRRALEQGGGLGALELRTGIVDILLRVLRPRKPQDLPVDLNEALGRLRSRIEADPERRWTTAELAASLGVSESYVYRVFREAVGQSPAAYIERLRVESACARLLRPGASITEVAFELGLRPASISRRCSSGTPV